MSALVLSGLEAISLPLFAFRVGFGSLVATILALALALLYHAAKPKPIPGIPYNAASASKLMGDIPSMTAHIKNREGTFITYIIELMQSLDTPIVQVFIRPFSKPLVVMGDFHEAHDLLIHRDKDFDRSDTLGDLVKGLAPDHHIHLKTNNEWKRQRRLVQDLMTPSFLHHVAGPALHDKVSCMVELWREKSRIAEGRPWRAVEDINHVALDAVMAFSFGGSFDHSATRPNLEALMRVALDRRSKEALLAGKDVDQPIQFPSGELDELLQAIFELTETVSEVQGNPWPALTWAWIMRRPRIKRAIRMREQCIDTALKEALHRLQLQDSKKGVRGLGKVQSAVDYMVVTETKLAAKDGRAPDYFSRVMMDEIFGFIFAGHETTSTTLCWGVKFLADNPSVQTRLRDALQTAFPRANSAARGDPTIQEMTEAHLPWLDAILEETLRCSGTAPVVDRQAVRDTQLLGHVIPKGTALTCLVTGPTMMSPGFEVADEMRSATSKAAHQDGRVRAWDPRDMAVFNPSRWINGRGEFDPAAGPQLAFGLGARGCYGRRLVYVEMRVVLTLLVWNFELLQCPPELSGYKPILITTNEPRQCYVRLREVVRAGGLT